RELEPVEEAERGFARVFLQREGDDAAEPSAELPLGDFVLRVVGEARIAHPRDLRVRGEVARDVKRALALARDAQRERAHAADHEPGLVWRKGAAVEERRVAPGAGGVGR